VSAGDAARHAPGEQQADPVSTTFFEFLSRLHQDEFTGVIVLHFAQGRPKVVEQPGPSVQVRLRD
jgi:hypothetical protein